MPKEHVVIFALLCVMAFGAGYWHSSPKGDSGERVEVAAPPAAAETRVIAEAREQSAIIEQAIRFSLKKFPGQLTQADLERVANLRLNYTKITDAGLKELVKMQKLKLLDLAHTPITDAGLVEVAKLEKLRWLHLGGTQITDAGLIEVGKLQTLTSLNLEGAAQITDAGLIEVAKLQQLRWLRLNATQITDAGLRELAKLQQLTSLDLWGTQITDVGLKEVAKIKQLNILHLSNTQITQAGVAELKKALPKCRISSKSSFFGIKPWRLGDLDARPEDGGGISP